MPNETLVVPVSFLPVPHLLEVAQVAHRLHFSPRFVWRLIRDGKLKVTRIESRLRVSEADLKAYVDGQNAQQVVLDLLANYPGRGEAPVEQRKTPRPATVVPIAKGRGA